VLAAVVGLGVLLSALATAWIFRRQPPRQPANPGAASQIAENAFLTDVHGLTPISRYVLGTKPVIIGRAPGRTSRQFDHITVALKAVGRRHAVIEYRDGGYWIADQGSINGTWLNGKRITGVRRLHNGDRIRMHQCEFQFELPGEQEGESTVVTGYTQPALVHEALATPPTAPPSRTDTQPYVAPTQPAPDLVATRDASGAPPVAASTPMPATTLTLRVAAGTGASVAATGMEGKSASERETMVLAPDAAATTQLPAASSTGVAQPTSAPPDLSLDAFISTTLLESATPDAKAVPSSAAGASMVATSKFVPKSTATESIDVEEMSIEDFLKEDASPEEPPPGALPEWEATNPQAPIAPTQPLEDILPAQTGGDLHVGDTVNLWADDETANKEATQPLADMFDTPIQGEASPVPDDAHSGDTVNFQAGADAPPGDTAAKSLRDLLWKSDHLETKLVEPKARRKKDSAGDSKDRK
jgi:pSer/pThr/pTyr-binding forkhead associated (FHA) protein